MSVFHRIDVTEVWRASEKTLTGLDKMQPRSHEEHEHEAHETHETTKYTKNTKQNSHRHRKNTRALGGVRRNAATRRFAPAGRSSPALVERRLELRQRLRQGDGHQRRDGFYFNDDEISRSKAQAVRDRWRNRESSMVRAVLAAHH